MLSRSRDTDRLRKEHYLKNFISMMLPTSSEFLHLHTSNAIPSSNDRSILQGLLSDIDQCVLDIDTSISQLEAKLADHRQRRVALRQKREVYASILSPLRFLPSEIFGEIFGFACDGDPPFILRLSQVCRLWRQAAHTTNSKFYNTIRLGRSIPEDIVEGYIATCISRACARPMNLIVDGVQNSSMHRQAIDRILGISRWKSVDWTADKPDSSEWFKPIFDQIMSNSAKCLENLAIYDMTTRSAMTWNFQRASHLKTISLEVRQISTTTLHLPWTKITSLSFTTCDPPHIDIFRLCAANLEECTLKYYTSNDEVDGNLPKSSVLFPKLRKLHIYAEFPYFITSMVVTPAIEDILLDIGTEKHIMSVSDMNWLFDSAHTIKKLSLTGVDNDEFGELLPILASIQELFIHSFREISEENMDTLIIRPDVDANTVLLPNLEIIHITCEPYRVQASFIAFARSRWWSDFDTMERPCAKLRYAALRDRNLENHLCCVDDVEELRLQGMNINVLMPSKKDRNYDGPFKNRC